MDKVSLKEILTKIKNKDEEGYKLLYDNYYKMMYSAAYAVLENSEDSKDAVQNAIMKLSKLDLDKFPFMGESSWLYNVVMNEARMIKRGIKYTENADDIGELSKLSSDINKLIDMNTFNSMLDGLNEKQKKIVSMKIVGDLKYNEIAELLNIPMGTVQWMYHTSIKKLRRQLTGVISIIIICGINFLYGMYNYKSKSGMMHAASVNYSKEYAILSFVLLAISIIVLIIYLNLPKKPTK